MSWKIVNIIVALIYLSIRAVIAQDIEFTGSAKQEVAIGESFSLIYSVNAQGLNFKGPNLSNFSIISGPNSSTSSNIRMINGRTSMTVSNSYTFILQAVKEGSFTIPAAAISVNNKVFHSNPISIKVVKGSTYGQNPSSPQRNNTGGGSSQNQGGAVQMGSNDVYLKALVSEANPIQGEGIIVTYKLFTKVPIQQITINKISSFPGFWSQNLSKENEKFNQYNQTIDGQPYVVADIRKIVLFPLKSGRLVIDPLEVECIAQLKKQSRQRSGDPFFDDFFNDPFFNNSVASVEKNLKSNPVVINVRPLPGNDKPADFSGAVGSFTFRTEVDKTHLKTNDPINLKCVVSGEGNIQLVDKMNVGFPPDFDAYDPKVSSDIKTTSSGITGSQTFEYLVVPRKPGKFKIKPISFSYFDLNRKKYITLTSPEYVFDVEKGTGESQTVTYSGQGKEEIKYIGSDIRFIKNQSIRLTKIGVYYFGSLVFYLSLLIPVLLFMTLIIIWRKQTEKRSDLLLMKNRKATKVARKRLKKAQNSLKANREQEFYEEISQAVWGYLSDKFSIPLSELSMDSVSQALSSRNVNEEITRQFIETLNNTEFARFAPGEKSIIMDKIYNEALDVITKSERELR
ncbi:MAG: BatD family protein [Bacteroidetes bacterium]|nr:BatD family protein [Bacteroidota bacterium]